MPRLVDLLTHLGALQFDTGVPFGGYKQSGKSPFQLLAGLLLHDIHEDLYSALICCSIRMRIPQLCEDHYIATYCSF